MSRIINNALFAAHFTGDNNGTSFPEETGITIAKIGTVITSTTQSKFNPASGYFNGSASYLSFPGSGVTLTGDFWIECWVYLTTVAAYTGILDGRSAASYNNAVFGIMNVSGTLRPDIVNAGGGSTRLTGTSTSVGLNSWHLVAFGKSSGTLMAFVDGVKDSTTKTYSSSMNFERSDVNIGRVIDPTYFTGYFQDLLILPTCLHTSSYTPETETWTYTPLPFKTLTYLANAPSNAIEVCQDIVPRTKYLMQGVDSLGTIVQWSTYAHDKTPTSTTPPATGAVSNIQILASF